MLLNLSIQNVAVIEKANVDFSQGFNILTGETGAGKSLLIDSLSMVLGMRTSRDLIRHGADTAFVTALFSDCPDLSDLDVEPEDDGSVLLSRKLFSDGRNMCKINGTTVPLSTLRSVGERLVTIHGQHDNIALLKPSYHLSILDEYAQNGDLLSNYKSAYSEAARAREALESGKMSAFEREEQRAALTARIDEIEKVSPEPGEDITLAEKRDALRNYSSIMLQLNSIADALTGQYGAKDALYSAMRSGETASGMDKSLSPISERLTDLYYTAEDIASEINSYTSRMSFSPEELDEIEDRLDAITKLKKKYMMDIPELLESLSKWQNELGELLFYEDNIAAMEAEAKALEEKTLNLGSLLHASRVAAAEKMAKSIEQELNFLDMPRVRFTVSFTEHEPTAKGLFDAEFLIATNPSESVKPLARIASGGEMSRIMLALKSALADCDDVGVLLFDEVDSGVSGRAAVKIAEKLRALSVGRQIICITHLPQMAAKAHNHLLVLKDTSTDSFRADVTLLDYTGRVKELTRLISGGEESQAARLAAEEMLSMQ